MVDGPASIIMSVFSSNVDGTRAASAACAYACHESVPRKQRNASTLSMDNSAKNNSGEGRWAAPPYSRLVRAGSRLT